MPRTYYRLPINRVRDRKFMLKIDARKGRAVSRFCSTSDAREHKLKSAGIFRYQGLQVRLFVVMSLSSLDKLSFR